MICIFHQFSIAYNKDNEEEIAREREDGNGCKEESLAQISIVHHVHHFL